MANDRLLAALTRFRDAALELDEAWEATNVDLAAEYPFPCDFAAVTTAICTWVEANGANPDHPASPSGRPDLA